MKWPFEPMIPISKEDIPLGDDWGYQLKWDGVRIIAKIHEGVVALYSRSRLNKNTVYPEMVHYLSQAVNTSCILDGEMIVFDEQKQRPVFQKVLQRGRQIRSSPSVSYVLFDILQLQEQDLSSLPYSQRFEHLKSLFPERSPQLFISDLFSNGPTLWEWVCEHQWEGMVSKKLSSPYRTGKKHQDSFKKKTAQYHHVSIIGIRLNKGIVASLVMTLEGQYFGKVSIGLNMLQKQRLVDYAQQHTSQSMPFKTMPRELIGNELIWLDKPFSCSVKGLEVTDAGLLRHPQIIDFTTSTSNMPD